MFAKTVEKLDEVFVEVKDLPTMRAFYKDDLGFEEEFYHEGWGVGLRTGGAALVLTKGDSGASGVSLVFACADIDRSLKAITDRGIRITQPVQQGHWGAKVAGFEDPERIRKGTPSILSSPAATITTTTTDGISSLHGISATLTGQ